MDETIASSAHAVSRSGGRLRLVPLALFVLVVLTVLAVRLPFLANPLVGEEGSHAALVLGDDPVSSRTNNGLPQILVGRIGGTELFGSFERNIVPYLLLDRVVRGTGLSGLVPQTSLEGVSMAARLPFLVLFAIGGAVLFRAALVGAAGLGGVAAAVPVLIAGYVLTTPLAVGASIQPQIDGSVGVFLIGVAAWIAGVRPEGRSRPFAAALLAGFIVALGKHEWAATLVAATVTAWIAVTVARALLPGAEDAQAVRRMHRTAAGLIAGSALGVVFCLWVSTQEYLYGIYLMDRISRMHNTAAVQFMRNLPFLYPLWGLIAVTSGILLAFAVRRVLVERFLACVFAVWGTGITVGFLWGAWAGDGFPRYFMPPLLLLGLFVILSCPRVLPAFPKPLTAGLALCIPGGIAANLASAHASATRGLSVTSHPGRNLTAFPVHLEQVIRRAHEEGIIIVDSSSVGIYSKTVEFVSEDMSWDGAVQFVRRVRPDRVDKLVATSP
ncbi:hypothetical protein GAY28_07980 [Azospirillum brasilense]|nr:hypothetical protein [Azospirillum brasilense]